MCTVGDEAPDRIWPAMAMASLIGIAKPCPRPRWKFSDAAVFRPITWLAALTVGPPESPGRMAASTWISPTSVSLLPVSASLADTVWFSAATRPSTALGAPPAPPALPIETIGAPTVTVSELPILAAGSPPPASCNTAMSC